MGEVYRARDTKLGRDVAVKLVLQVFADDHDRLVRFEREARTLAALNHSGIATLYGLEQAAAPDSVSPVHFLVMELVEGQTLEEVIKGGDGGLRSKPRSPSRGRLPKRSKRHTRKGSFIATSNPQT